MGWSRRASFVIALTWSACTVAACVEGASPARAPSNPTPADVARVAQFVDGLPRCAPEGGEVGLREALASPSAVTKRVHGWLRLGSGICTLLQCVRTFTGNEEGVAASEAEPICCNGCGGSWMLAADRGQAQGDPGVMLLDSRGEPWTWGGKDCSLPAMKARASVEVIAVGVLREKSQHWIEGTAEMVDARLCVVSQGR